MLSAAVNVLQEGLQEQMRYGAYPERNRTNLDQSAYPKYHAVQNTGSGKKKKKLRLF